MIPGPEITLADRKFVVPPLPFNALQQHKAFLSRAQRGQLDVEQMIEKDYASMFACVYASLKRNYKELTEAELADLIDMRNINEAFAAVMGAVGFKEKGPGEP